MVKKQNLRVLGTNILLKLEEAKKESEGGIVIPDCVIENVQTAEVLSISTEVEEVKVGDKVIFSHKGMLTKIELNNETFFVCDVENILCIVEDK